MLECRFGEFNSLINDEKSKFNEVQRALESVKREFYQNMETERTRVNTVIGESRETALILATDRIEKTKEDILTRIRDVERVSNFSPAFYFEKIQINETKLTCN